MQEDSEGMTTTEMRAYIRKHTPELLKQLVVIAESANCENARSDAVKVLTSRGYVRTARSEGPETTVTWRLKN